ncbi:MAG TPA: hypothetical protein VMU04_08240 [Candidatus Acidoferrum sp.]|nr:hypothetical protein [Candidatus Acidoferrum sp.]
MERYKNLTGGSGVSAFELGRDSITVEFNDGSRYLYNSQNAGQDNIEQMKALAARGSGLNAFINTHVKKAYAAKLR